MILEPGTTCGRYVVEGLLGQGAMATVYKIRHRDLGSLHALKVLSVRDPHVRERFRREGMVQSQLRHPNVVAVTDTIEVNDAPGLVMELVDGPPLDRLVAARRPRLDQCDHLARGLLEGVSAAHAFGTVHRDLKPANILVAITPTAPVPKVSDFGVAKVLDSSARQTRSGTGLGTPAYMAPEQMRDASSVGPRADVFSLGAILYELVTGRMAFEGDDLLEVLQLVASGEYRAPRELEPELPPRMEQAIVAALQLDPAARPPDAGALLELWTDGTTLPVQPWDVPSLTLLRSVSEQHSSQRIVTPRSRALSPLDPAANLPTKLVDRRDLPRRPPPARSSRWLWVVAGTGVAFVAATGALAVVLVLVALGLWSLG